MKNYIMNPGTALAAICFVACSSAPPLTEFADNADPTVEIRLLQENIRRDEAQQINVLAPESFASATEALKRAESDRAKNKKQTDVLHDIALGNGYLAKAEQSAKTSKAILSDVTQSRQLALEAKAPKNFPKRFSEAENDLTNATRNIEAGNTDQANSEKKKLNDEYASLELQSILKNNLGSAEAKMKQAQDEGAAKLAPKTLSWAQIRMTESNKAIEQDRHNIGALENASTTANAASERLLKMVRQAKSSAGQSPEDLATALENDQLEAEAANTEYNQQLSQSSQKLSDSKEIVQQKNQDIMDLSAKNSALAAGDRQEQNYASARALFTKDEADVYKQGDKILIRLKGFSFPSAKSTISASNYPILSKVQKTIKDSGSLGILVEGHTDSTGSKIRNETLSQARADSVEHYLVANNQEGSDKIAAKGYGDTQPIATNKTVAGRAQNRRVDVILSPAAAE
jgi:outer membrane protein OmpA-like peptidoglycan-associated protein